jgi:F-type H+-transporting ATPase subunit a
MQMSGILKPAVLGTLAVLVVVSVIGFFISQSYNTQHYAPQPSIKAEALFTIGPLHFTNSMLMTLIVGALIIAFFVASTRRLQLVPGKAQNIAEMAVEGLLGLTESVAGKRTGRIIFPLIATLFIFIIAANYLSLFPGVGSIGGCYHEEAPAAGQTVVHYPQCGEGQVFVPFLRAPTADLNTTLAMALIAVTIVQITGVVSHGVGGYIKELFTPVWLGPVHIVGELSRIISLSFRLFGNIFGGEVLLLVMYFLLGGVYLGFGVVIFLGLEVLFGGIQALLFSLLTLTYITLAASGHGSSGEHHAEAEHQTGQPIDHPQTGTEAHMA